MTGSQHPTRPRVTGSRHPRLLVIAGKGGVGRSTVAAAVGVAAATHGLRTVVAEVDGHSDVWRALGGGRAGRGPAHADGAGSARELRPGLWHVSIDRRSALVEYLRTQTPGRLPGALLARSHAFELFVEATPGLAELLTLGKVWELVGRPGQPRHAAEYDLVVLDAPATGQLTAMLAAPRTFGAIARVGPVARQAQAIDRSLHDPHTTAVVAVATPEQMPVSEAIGLRDTLAAQLGIGLHAVVVNRLFPRRFTAAEAALLADAPSDPAIDAARWYHSRAVSQGSQMTRLRRALPGVSRITLPQLFSGEVDGAGIGRLAGRLAGRLP